MTALGETFAFFERLGVYEILLPFLLVFTLVFAILEKTAILGFDETRAGTKITKKNQNSMISFTIAFIVVASSEVVRIMNQVIADTVILLVVSVCFLMLVGVFHEQGENGFFLDPKKNGAHKFMYWFFMIAMVIGIVLIFMNALGWLDMIYYYLTAGYNSSTVGSIITVLVFIGIIMFVTGGGPKKDPDGKENEG